MTQQDKDLLLKDLCARLPYGVKISTPDGNQTLVGNICTNDGGKVYTTNMLYSINQVKPYLRPMSSMTEDEKKEIYNWLVENDVDWFDFSILRFNEILISFDSSWLLVNWLLKNHFDFMGLIPKGLALEAPEGMYNLN